MALINCPNCQSKISEFAKTCINCKHEFSTSSNATVTQKTSATNEFTVKKTKSKTWLIVLLCVLALPCGILIGLIGDKIKSKDRQEKIEKSYGNQSSSYQEDYNQSNSEEKNACSICGKLFIGKGYEEATEGIWKECQEPYQCFICSKACGKRQTQQMNNLVNETENNSNPYKKGSDGKLHESNACSLCKGTGIEKNTSSLSDEYGRKCPMCDGKGVRSY